MHECPQCGACYGDGELCPADRARLALVFPGPNVVDGKYLIERRIGEGGMGVVYAAQHIALHRRMAVKVIRAPMGEADRFLDRFRREAEALGKLEHPNIVDVTDFGIDGRAGGLPYLVMEYLDGTTLDALSTRHPVTVEEALPIFAAVAKAIDYAHAQGFVHRDLKPGNIFLANENGVRVPKVLDFGLVARPLAPEREDTLPEFPVLRVDSRGAPVMASADAITAKIATVPVATAFRRTETATRDGTLVGTLGYIAPELLGGANASAATDLYALGMLMYVTLTGALPFDAHGFDLINEQLTQDPIPPSVRRGVGREPLPPELDAPLLALLARNADERPRTAVEAVAAIERAWRAARRRTWLRAELPRRATIAVLASLLVTGALFAARNTGPVAWLEGKLIDLRFNLSERREPDRRIILAVFDEASLRADATTLADRSDEVGTRLQRALDAGARGVAVDLLLPRKWGASKPFLDLVLRNPDRVVLAAQSAEGGVIGTDPVTGVAAVALGPEKAAQLFGFVEMDVDADGVTRRGTIARESHPSFAARAASLLGAPASGESFLLDYRTDVTRYPRISWRDFEIALAARPQLFRNALVLVGAEFTGSGDEFHRLPVAPGVVSGVTVQALAIDTIAARMPVRSHDAVALFVLTAIAAAIVFLLLLTLPRIALPLTVAIVSVAAILVTAVLVFRNALLMIPAAAPLLVVIVITVAGALLRGRMSRVP